MLYGWPEVIDITNILPLAFRNRVDYVDVIRRAAGLPCRLEIGGRETTLEVISQHCIAVAGKIHVGERLAGDWMPAAEATCVAIQLPDSVDGQLVDKPLWAFSNINRYRNIWPVLPL